MALYDEKTKEELQAIVDSSETLLEIGQKMGYQKKTASSKLRDKLIDIGISFNEFDSRKKEKEGKPNKNARRSRIWKMTKEEFQNLIDESNSYEEVRRKLKLSHSSSNDTIKQRIEEDGILMTAFFERQEKLLKDKVRKMRTKIDVSIYLRRGSKISSSALRIKIIKEGILKEECVKCGIGPEYNGEPLTLQLDHIDGDRTNNEITNLRILCPNCHAQTETYSGKNKILQQKCQDCGIKVYRFSKRCSPCERINRIRINTRTGRNRKVIHRPTKEDLIRMIVKEKLSFLKIGEKYGVSDTAIRKWCVAEGLPYKKKDIKEKKEELLKML